MSGDGDRNDAFDGDSDARDDETDETDETDAFDSLDDGTAMDDPFTELGEGIGAAESEPNPDAGDRRRERSDDAAAVPRSVATNADAEGDDPTDELGDLDAERSDPFDDASGEWDDETGDLDDAFERMDVSGPAESDVWASLDADDENDAGLGATTSAPGGGDTEHVVSKRTYCQQCPHFTEPPEVACTHEGTTIVEAVGYDEFRVRNCPMISEEDPTFHADR